MIETLKEQARLASIRYTIAAKAYDAAVQYRHAFDHSSDRDVRAELVQDVAYADVHVERAKENLEDAHRAWRIATARVDVQEYGDRVKAGDTTSWVKAEYVAAMTELQTLEDGGEVAAE